MGGSDPSVERYDPNLWTDEFYFLNQPGQSDIQKRPLLRLPHKRRELPQAANAAAREAAAFTSDLGKYELSFDPAEPEAYRRDAPKTEVHIADGGPLALDTAADHIAQLVRGFLK